MLIISSVMAIIALLSSFQAESHFNERNICDRPVIADKEKKCTSELLNTQRREAVKEAFLHSWRGYEKFAWGADELKPISKKENNWLGGMGTTIIDSLSTLWIMGFRSEYEKARKWVQDNFNMESGKCISLFEATIRILGGLLSIYDLTGDELYLDKAEMVGNILIKSFVKTNAGIPNSLVCFPKQTHDLTSDVEILESTLNTSKKNTNEKTIERVDSTSEDLSNFVSANINNIEGREKNEPTNNPLIPPGSTPIADFSLLLEFAALSDRLRLRSLKQRAQVAFYRLNNSANNNEYRQNDKMQQLQRNGMNQRHKEKGTTFPVHLFEDLPFKAIYSVLPKQNTSKLHPFQKALIAPHEIPSTYHPVLNVEAPPHQKLITAFADINTTTLSPYYETTGAYGDSFFEYLLKDALYFEYPEQEPRKEGKHEKLSTTSQRKKNRKQSQAKEPHEKRDSFSSPSLLSSWPTSMECDDCLKVFPLLRRKDVELSNARSGYLMHHWISSTSAFLRNAAYSRRYYSKQILKFFGFSPSENSSLSSASGDENYSNSELKDESEKADSGGSMNSNLNETNDQQIEKSLPLSQVNENKEAAKNSSQEGSEYSSKQSVQKDEAFRNNISSLAFLYLPTPLQSNETQHLGCFYPGNIKLGASLLKQWSGQRSSLSSPSGASSADSSGEIHAFEGKLVWPDSKNLSSSISSDVRLSAPSSLIDSVAAQAYGSSFDKMSENLLDSCLAFTRFSPSRLPSEVLQLHYSPFQLRCTLRRKDADFKKRFNAKEWLERLTGEKLQNEIEKTEREMRIDSKTAKRVDRIPRHDVSECSDPDLWPSLSDYMNVNTTKVRKTLNGYVEMDHRALLDHMKKSNINFDMDQEDSRITEDNRLLPFARKILKIVIIGIAAMSRHYRFASSHHLYNQSNDGNNIRAPESASMNNNSTFSVAEVSTNQLNTTLPQMDEDDDGNTEDDEGDDDDYDKSNAEPLSEEDLAQMYTNETQTNTKPKESDTPNIQDLPFKLEGDYFDVDYITWLTEYRMGLHPFTYPPFRIPVSEGYNILRPEIAESLFYFYRTSDSEEEREELQKEGWSLFMSFVSECEVEAGYASVAAVWEDDQCPSLDTIRRRLQSHFSEEDNLKSSNGSTSAQSGTSEAAVEQANNNSINKTKEKELQEQDRVLGGTDKKEDSDTTKDVNYSEDDIVAKLHSYIEKINKREKSISKYRRKYCPHIPEVHHSCHTYVDVMPSYWLSETLKYLYLLFSPVDEEVPLDCWVFNTEAQPFLKRRCLLKNRNRIR
ncbi:putative endoplasmic reticulum mannosyl-oligosaccharide 1,2-alpha-mannosidase-like protein [Monocercomonoides exilis]|uniref:putative endoplasmic reticulum mannosyl-oligosaccharide 1,2-alpha-mannosidase-like protein n=1 Tax=Monocercomonoides exilis TaxID=2049356 RepID=UPI00355A19A0|nr:putative endoplasmic reticulum mannosyl-oligosaccharide 1,2-alpha-mannosidase-like protein [Monocercomonoides exilis]|eukprot:MONOS_5346.1-p1 / transcript=MONOS_5346.1 / gene=MONOS_5346 / organism=Monocercomonoides_exilis_PA203 / gene_product=endoplasmic reticulum mannosyl-oligosaccharide 1,2-alpha-mannosidase-like protein / transcript_product=endoplasmic reticulum mannosyl-oligosaccharide 1,2-alpha-mannosidase-like protein / location=Mono_scaffold00154:68230-72382(+) / protein_length=1281 / sequence_SO=supercontig / SO=protein_coding / is_pseudo=false